MSSRPAAAGLNPTTPSLAVPQRLWRLLGPAFVAAVAYVDPGNVAANITAGARYGYLLVWVLVVANLIAVVVQYQSAKLGIVAGKSLPELLGERLPTAQRISMWAQAEIVAAATDIAELIGGAIALNLLFGIPLFLGGVIVAVVSLLLLLIQNYRYQRAFESTIIGLLVLITAGFMAGLFFSPPSPSGIAHGLIPGFAGTDSVLIAASMLGATVMPHAIYLHSSLVIHRHGTTGSSGTEYRISPKRLLRASRWDVVWALLLAGAVNIGLLLLAASALGGQDNTDTIDGAHAAIESTLGHSVGIIFAIGLLASGLASTSVGAYAGSEIMKGLLHIRIPVSARRLITVIPGLALLWWGVEPTWALVISQVVLSFGIPLAILPLFRYTANPTIMGEFVDSPFKKLTTLVIALFIVGLNALLLVLTFTGVGV
ncbi:Mn(2+) uptake NRAMP transporter MntH [Corynebacterium poyangense]|uniref:Mn(2+) uptake NRAMP transporter MntH n=1 Tax=Corynebacterium poyangense TaxID=2684405 RepID=A0A7H0SRK5_9CORY|nr:Mn(2+) uptake NRAMP transporter MntH [Corynebacterium poyangense]